MQGTGCYLGLQLDIARRKLPIGQEEQVAIKRPRNDSLRRNLEKEFYFKLCCKCIFTQVFAHNGSVLQVFNDINSVLQKRFAFMDFSTPEAA